MHENIGSTACLLFKFTKLRKKKNSILIRVSHFILSLIVDKTPTKLQNTHKHLQTHIHTLTKNLQTPTNIYKTPTNTYKTRTIYPPTNTPYKYLETTYKNL